MTTRKAVSKDSKTLQAVHTPGPWKFKRTHGLSSDTWYVITDADGFGPVVEVGGKDKSGQIAEAKYLITDPEKIEANARLIAASPTMYSYILKKAEEGDAEARSIIANL